MKNVAATSGQSVNFYVPPDTMKNVAATSGQSVNFPALFFAMGSAWEGIWAGSDKVLNFFLSSS